MAITAKRTKLDAHFDHITVRIPPAETAFPGSVLICFYDSWSKRGKLERAAKFCNFLLYKAMRIVLDILVLLQLFHIIAVNSFSKQDSSDIYFDNNKQE